MSSTDDLQNEPQKKQPECTFRISVKGLIEFCCRSGDLFAGFRRGPSAQEGIRAHQRIQKKRPDGYKAEVAVKHIFTNDDFELKIGGRIDGVFTESEPVIIEEIKTTLYAAESLPDSLKSLHLAQAKIYAYLYCLENQLDECQIQMTYYHIEKKRESSFISDYSLDDLSDFFKDITQQYLRWLEKIVSHRKQRNSSIKNLEFPYGDFRPGQREMAVQVYRSIVHENQLIAQAPTGIGKTISALFPAIKAIGENKHDMILYLTAKTVGGTVAESALEDMNKKGLALKSLRLTAKDKICFCKNSDEKTDTGECPYTVGFFDRLNQALDELFEYSLFTRSVIESIAHRHQLCPFELSLEMALWVDVLIGDYNYVFHPSASLKRLKEDTQCRKTILIDEAHNLVDRARDMFTVSLKKQGVLDLRKRIKTSHAVIARKLNGINKAMLQLKKECRSGEMQWRQKDDNSFVHLAPPAIENPLKNFCEAVEQWMIEETPEPLPEGVGEELIDFYFQVLRFLKIFELFDEHFITLLKITDYRSTEDVELTLYCLDPSQQLNETYTWTHNAVLFSATLKPFEYYSTVLGMEQPHTWLELPSPFPPQNLGVFITKHIKTTYVQRENYYGDIAELIIQVIGARHGKYLVYFPSYRFMKAVKELVDELNPDTKIIEQKSVMDDAARMEFLEHFTASDTAENLLGFAIMGGLFGEGVDLPGNQLIGVIVVSVGLPQICVERDLIKEYFDQIQWPGFAFSYQYPGMNRVLQTAGRVIRGYNDKGVVILVDDRFNQRRYKELFPRHWKYSVVRQTDDLGKQLKIFWDTTAD